MRDHPAVRILVRALLGAGLALVVLAPPSALAATFFVRPSGDDAAPGTSPDTAWQSLARVNNEDLDPGDRVLLEGGETFPGFLYLAPEDAGDAANPIVIASFGPGDPATLDAGSAGGGVFAWDVGGIELRRLIVRGSGPGSNPGTGVFFYTDRADGAKLEHVRIHELEVSGFRTGGITFGSWHVSRPGYVDVEVTGCEVHDNGESGIETWDWYDASDNQHSHQDFLIARNEVHTNRGDPFDVDSHTGNGIVVGGVDGALIELNHAYANGGLNSENSGGPIGIWAWDANNVTIQHNISHHNKTGGYADGGGFDLDGGVTNSVVQYNYSYANDGAGYGVFQFDGAPTSSNNVVRYNVSFDDGRANGFGGITLWTAAGDSVSDVDIYGNTVYVSPASDGSPRGFYALSGTYSGVTVRNNIFITSGGLDVFRSDSSLDPSEVVFQGNSYWASGWPLILRDGGSAHASLAAWRAASGQELLGANPVGFEIDPLLIDPAAGEPLTDPTQIPTLMSFRLQASSPMIDTGLDLLALFGIDPGPRDLFGQAVPQGAGPDVGAEERGPQCGDGVDNDGDGLSDWPDDPGCNDAADLSERRSTTEGAPFFPCDDGIDNDGDGGTDFDPLTLADPLTGTGDASCWGAFSKETQRCQDGKDNDADGLIDFDGGTSLDLNNDGLVDAQFNAAQPAITSPDPQCSGLPWSNKERPGCGLGAELLLLLPPLMWLQMRRRGAA